MKVTWTDACSRIGWRTKKEIKSVKLPVIETVGILLHVSDDAVHTAGDHNVTYKNYNSVGIIPRGWILSAEELTAAT